MSAFSQVLPENKVFLKCCLRKKKLVILDSLKALTSPSVKISFIMISYRVFGKFSKHSTVLSFWCQHSKELMIHLTLQKTHQINCRLKQQSSKIKI